MNVTLEHQPGKVSGNNLALKAEQTIPSKASWYSPLGLWHRKTTIIAVLSIGAIFSHLALRFGFRATSLVNAVRAAFPPKVIHDL